jgi:2-haloacid dehalogenase
MKSDKKPAKAIVFDAYGTLFDLRSVVTAINQKFPGMGPAVRSQWRAKQLEYTWLRSSMDRYEDFWKVTESALIFTCNEMKLRCDAVTRAQLMESNRHLDLVKEAADARIIARRTSRSRAWSSNRRVSCPCRR